MELSTALLEAETTGILKKTRYLVYPRFCKVIASEDILSPRESP